MLSERKLKGSIGIVRLAVYNASDAMRAYNAGSAQDQGEYQISSEPQDFPACESLMHSKRYNSLVERYERAKARFDEVTEAIAQRSAKGERLRREASPFRGRGSSGHLRRRKSLWRSSMSGCGARWWTM